MGPQYTRTEMERATTPLLCLVLLLGLEGKGLDALSPQGCYTNYHHRHLRRGPGDERRADVRHSCPMCRGDRAACRRAKCSSDVLITQLTGYSYTQLSDICPVVGAPCGGVRARVTHQGNFYSSCVPAPFSGPQESPRR